jgi:hypothetical protein
MSRRHVTNNASQGSPFHRRAYSSKHHRSCGESKRYGTSPGVDRRHCRVTPFAQRAALRQHLPRSHELIVSGAPPDSQGGVESWRTPCANLHPCRGRRATRRRAHGTRPFKSPVSHGVRARALREVPCAFAYVSWDLRLKNPHALHGACPCARHARRHGATQQRRLFLASCDAAQPATSVSTLFLQSLSRRRPPQADAFASRPAHARGPVGCAEADGRAACWRAAATG